MTAPAAEPQLTGNVLFYRQPEPLSLDRHRTLGVRRIDRPFLFLGQAHVVPITVNEFGVAAASFPVIFAGEAKTPLAVMGARPGDNVFVSPAGEVDPEAYLPAFVRRYPFVFAHDAAAERLVLCIDRAAPMVGENPEIPLFNGDQPSQYTQDAMEFCKEFERHRQATDEFVKILNEFGLFEEKSVSITQNGPDGQPGQTVKVADYFAISEEKLQTLPADQIVALRDRGMLGPIYAHMVSLLLWQKVIQRTLIRADAMAQAAERAQTPLA